MKRILILGMLLLLVSSIWMGSTSHVIAAEPLTTTFSFASDTYHQGPTFTGGKNIFTSEAEVELIVDKNADVYGGTVSFLSQLSMKAEIREYRVYYVGSQYLHVWKVYAEGYFNHVDATAGNPPILAFAFKEGVLTSWSSSPSTVGETMTLQDCESADPSLYLKPDKLLNGIGIFPEHLALGEGIAFTFTHVRSADGQTN
ncbi:MAG TPA: hypothetical protein VHR47_00665, partial [Bacillota bacterium]|nr:hypothetical protein [Bacillota bacterium]